MSADERPRLALSNGAGGPPEGGPGRGQVNSRDASFRLRSEAIDWSALAPYWAEDEAAKSRRRKVPEGERPAS